MIRLVLAAATACAVVWAAGGNFGSLVPDPARSRDVLDRSARALKEVASLVAEPPHLTEPAPQQVAERNEFGPEALPSVAPSTAFVPAPSTAFVPAPSTAHADAADGAPAEWREPLDAAQAEAVRSRLDRVMSLASGATH